MNPIRDLKIYYTYVLLSTKDNQLYTGVTNNLKERFRHHKNGLVSSTKNRTPLNLFIMKFASTEKMLIVEKSILKQVWVKNILKID